MAGAGRSSTPCGAEISRRRGWRPFGRHDDNSTAVRLNLPAVCCNAKQLLDVINLDRAEQHAGEGSVRLRQAADDVEGGPTGLPADDDLADEAGGFRMRPGELEVAAIGHVDRSRWPVLGPVHNVAALV